MRKKAWQQQARNRVRFGPTASDDRHRNNGQFIIDNPGTGRRLLIQVSDEAQWDHISVSTPVKCPTWEDMDFIKRLFFRPDEWAMQLHAPEDLHINIHPYCLHIWKPQHVPIPTPPSWMVGF